MFVRSRKVSGQGFLDRGNEHRTTVKVERPLSAFYKEYPSKESARATNKRSSHVESLLQVVAARFNPKSEHVANLDSDYKNNGIFILAKDDERLIKFSMNNLKCSTKVKFRHILAYQIELGYDLALAPGDVLSANTGFESVLDVF